METSYWLCADGLGGWEDAIINELGMIATLVGVIVYVQVCDNVDGYELMMLCVHNVTAVAVLNGRAKYVNRAKMVNNVVDELVDIQVVTDEEYITTDTNKIVDSISRFNFVNLCSELLNGEVSEREWIYPETLYDLIFFMWQLSS